MFSLVAAYSDSSDDEGEKTDVDTQSVPNIDKNEGKQLSIKSGGSQQNATEQNLFKKEPLGTSCTDGDSADIIEDEDEDYMSGNKNIQPVSCFQAECDDDEEEEEYDEDTRIETDVTTTQKLHLGNPFRLNHGDSSQTIQDSVFEIPFLDQETKKSAALERHVKMTQAAGTHEMINGKKICWNFRKGKCRFGHNCTFAHDSDIQQATEKKSADIKSQTYLNATDQQANQVSEGTEETAVISSPHLATRTTATTGIKINSDDLSPERKNRDGIGKKGKKRHGLSQTLEPGKKVMKAYYQNQP